MKSLLLLLAATWLLTGGLLRLTAASPASSGFTYQGRLGESGSPVTGNFEFRFRLLDASADGLQVGPILTNAPVAVTEGVFQTTLDFGLSPFAGDARWLEIGVRPAGSATAWTVLSPRQPLTATPYALFALNSVAGPQGPIGPQGPAGLTGAAGPAGPQGAIGPIGLIGSAGPTGPKGDKGDPGTNGLAGATGPAGPQGIPGNTGPVGPQGPIGLTGATGSQGPIGPIGPTGAQGIPGVAGTAGPKGDKGEPGTNGTNGLAGAAGPQGPIGPKGDPGTNGTNGLAGAAGPAGPQGVPGNAGPVGPQGPIGLTGSTGPTGAQGLPGVAGPQGPTGPTGAKGLNWRGPWAAGASYFAGDAVSDGGVSWIAKTGSTGVTPAVGIAWDLISDRGATGATGPAGAQGLPGVAGPQGPIGPIGPIGLIGPTGAQGAAGPAGPIGPTGATGPRGLTWRGTWTGTSNYVLGDAVVRDGASWFAKAPSSNATPILGSPNWDLLADKGANGANGTNGTNGLPGPIGPIGPIGLTGPTGSTGPQGSPGSADAWSRTGNAGANPTNGAFLGTTDNQPLEFKVNGTRGLRLQPASGGSVHVIGGYSGNVVNANLAGTIAGGGGDGAINQVTGNYSAVGGGAKNTAGRQATVAGGIENTASAVNSTVAGGVQNTASGAASMVPGGYQNTAAGDGSFAAGTQAKANHDGAFVWADFELTDFASTAANQFLVRAAGGVGIGKNNPATALDVNGTVTATSFTGDGSGLTGISAASVTSGTVPAAALDNAWKSTGNAGINPAVNFLGTTDNQPLEFRVNGNRGLRIQGGFANGGGTPNLIGGGAANTITAGSLGSVIGGGGNGEANSINGDASNATIAGGKNNTASRNDSSIGGGANNTASNFGATVAGGNSNIASGPNSAVGGGANNTASNVAATEPGGDGNTASGGNSFAAGNRAKAIHSGAFVWADLNFTDFASTANNQFLIRAAGGVGIGKNNPATALDVNGTVTATSFTGDGSGLTGISAANVTSGTVPAAALDNAWKSTGNAGINPAVNFLGTTDNQPLEFKVNGTRGLRLEFANDAGNTGVNVIGGYSGNVVSGARAATIAGGGRNGAINQVTDSFGTVGGGENNTAGFRATVAGGAMNTASGFNSTVPGGALNTAAGTGSFAVGNQAKANHDGAFVWADYTLSDFASTAANQFLIRAAGGVGIGTNNPADRLHLVGTGTRARVQSTDATFAGYIAKNSAAEWFTGVGGSGGEWLLHQNSPSSAPRLVVTTSGKVGIGTETPATALHVKNDAPNAGVARFDNRHSSGFAGIYFDEDNQYRGLVGYVNSQSSFGGPGTMQMAARGSLVFSAEPNGFFAERMRINGTNGNVGIGTDTPATRLTVATATASYGIEHTDGTRRLSTYLSTSGGWFGTRGPDPLNFFVNSGGAAMTILTSGNVGIGRSPSANRLEVEGNASKTTASGWAANSDRRIKQDIRTVESALDTLDRVRLVSFRYTDDYRAAHPSVTDRPYLNVIAQEFAEVFPDHVQSSGEKLPDGSEILQVDTYPLTIYTAAAVQELKDRVETEVAGLRQENAALKARLDRLEQLLLKGR